jgi:N-acylneuraminate cytidylyltransferase
MSNVAIIPARGGSKRIPRKNIKDFLGKPVIVYSIEAALESGLFDKVMVSTDDEEIAEIAREYGAEVPFMRSQQNSNDHATTSDVIIEVLERFQKEGISFDNACCIYPCNPLLKQDSLMSSYVKLNSGNGSVLPIVAYGYPIQRALKTIEQSVFWVNPENALKRSQDLEMYYHDCGQFYWIKIADFLKDGKLISANSGFLILNEMEVQDIDTETDWLLAELKYKLMYGMAY